MSQMLSARQSIQLAAARTGPVVGFALLLYGSTTMRRPACLEFEGIVEAVGSLCANEGKGPAAVAQGVGGVMDDLGRGEDRASGSASPSRYAVPLANPD
ncbi:hypothetical protein [Streptomyces chryseus]